MARNVLQDMVRVNKKPLPKREVRRERERIEIPEEIRAGGKKSKYRIYFVALIAVAFLLFALSYLFSAAKVTIIPKVKEISINENLNAYKDGNSSDLTFDLVVISGEEKKTITGGEEKDVALKAVGNVVIFNSFSSAPQVLDIDTRLEGSNGKIYKTVKKITVPGIKKDGNPGSIEVGIYGSQPGEEYNSGPLDFKIYGFKGTSKYSKIFAKSKSGSAGQISGGYKGKASVVSDLEKMTAISEMKTTLENKLLKKVADQIPKGFVLFNNATFLSINDSDVAFKSDENNLTTASVKGTLYGFLFDEKKLTKKIAEDVVDKYDGNDIYMPNIKNLTFKLSDKENISFSDVKTINFNLSGNAKFIWKIDKEKFITDALGKKKNSFNDILLKYPNIESAELVLRPFWKASFPEKSKNIEIIVNYPAN